MFIFNSNYTKALDHEALTRLTRLKKAADRVYEYYTWLNSDYRNKDHENHEQHMVELRQDVKTALFFSDNNEPLVNYFIACVLSAIMLTHESAATENTSNTFPISQSGLEGMYDAKRVCELLTDANYKLLSYSSGCFFLGDETDPNNLSTMELMRAGTLVAADQELTETINLRILLDSDPEAEELDEAEQGAFFLQELRLVDAEACQNPEPSPMKSSDA